MSELADLLREYSVQRGEFVLASGAKSPYYLDVRRTALTGVGARAIGRAAFERLQREVPGASGCGGLTFGADPIITAICCAAADAGCPWGGVVVRKEPKSHGTQNWLEIAGNLRGDEELVAVDDVVTSAGSTLRAIERLREHGFRVDHALCVVDREAGGREALAEHGVALHALFSMSELLGGGE